jgi:S1-C subfamily serine protease
MPIEQKTVIVPDTDQIATAVAKASQSVVRLYSSDATDPQFLGLGIIVDATGMIVTDTATLGGMTDANIKRANGSYVHVIVTKRDDMHSIAFLALASTSTDPSSFGIPATFSSKALALGDRAIAIEGSAVTRIQPGFITALPTATDTRAVAVIETDIPKSGIVSGTPIINIEGAIIGISTEVARTIAENDFVPATVFTAQTSHGTIKETAVPASQEEHVH